MFRMFQSHTPTKTPGKLPLPGSRKFVNVIFSLPCLAIYYQSAVAGAGRLGVCHSCPFNALAGCGIRLNWFMIIAFCHINS